MAKSLLRSQWTQKWGFARWLLFGPDLKMRFLNGSFLSPRVGCPSRQVTGRTRRRKHRKVSSRLVESSGVGAGWGQPRKSKHLTIHRLALQRDNPTAPPKGVSLARASKFRGGELSTVLYLHEEYAPQRLLSAWSSTTGGDAIAWILLQQGDKKKFFYNAWKLIQLADPRSIRERHQLSCRRMAHKWSDWSSLVQRLDFCFPQLYFDMLSSGAGGGGEGTSRGHDYRHLPPVTCLHGCQVIPLDSSCLFWGNGR